MTNAITIRKADRNHRFGWANNQTISVATFASIERDIYLGETMIGQVANSEKGWVISIPGLSHLVQDQWGSWVDISQVVIDGGLRSPKRAIEQIYAAIVDATEVAS